VMKDRGPQALNNVWKALLQEPGFLVHEKAYPKVPQCQGKEMRNLGYCVLGDLVRGLRQQKSLQLIHVKDHLRCVRALVNLSIMAQYQSHTTDTIAYMEHYLDK